MNNSQALPREVIKWLDSLDLAYQIRNVRRDLANGFIMAEIISRKFPKEINIYSFYNGLNKDKKVDNWQQIAKYLKEFYKLEISPQEYEPVINQAPDAAFQLLIKIYEHITKKSLNLDKRPQVQAPQEQPSYARPTAGSLVKDRELLRIVDVDQKRNKVMEVIGVHNEKQRQLKQDSNIIEYLIMKRRQQQEELMRQEEEALLERKRKYNVADTMQPDIKEIQLKSYNSSTSKKTKEQQGQLMEHKGVLDFLQEHVSSLLKKDPIAKDLKALNLDDKKQQLLVDIFNKCDEVTKKTMKILIETFLDSHAQFIVDTINNNFLDFKKFFFMYLKAIEYLKITSKTYKNILNLYKTIGEKLHQIEPQGTQMMFENILLSELLNIIKKYPNKRNSLCGLFYHFCGHDSISRLRLIKKIKSFLAPDLSTFQSILAFLISEEYTDFDQELYAIFFDESIKQLTAASPLSRTNCKIINLVILNKNLALKVLNELCVYSPLYILSKLNKLNNLIHDQWWEVKAQILIICSNLLLYLAEEEANQSELVMKAIEEKKMDLQENFSDVKSVRSSQSKEEAEQLKMNSSKPKFNSNQNEDITQEEKEKMKEQIEKERSERQQHLMEIVSEIFSTINSQNILSIGLIYLAPVLNYYPTLCERYLDILLNTLEKLRQAILDTNPNEGKEQGPVVSGCNSFSYKLTSAPKFWNSVGIAQAMDNYVKSVKLGEFNKEHLEILLGCLYLPLYDKDAQTWVEIYESLKNLIFLALTEVDLCSIASEILKKIFLFQTIQEPILKNSKDIFLKLLSLVYHPDIDQFCKDNLLGFFNFLNLEGEQFKSYTFEIIKDFSEKNKNQFLKSNLVEFMNNLAKERRKNTHTNLFY